MTLAIVHYHLDPGGVSQVIRSTSAILTRESPASPHSAIPHVILVGTAPEDADHLPVCVVDGLAYQDFSSATEAVQLVARMRAAAASMLGGPPDVWHFHNHSLGKNPALTRAVAILAAQNERIVLQIHDLAEDGRPSLYQKISNIPDLYPFSPRIRYAFLNSRDLKTFADAGLPADHAILLPNPHTCQTQIPTSPPPLHNLLFAPIRGIRRKNLGELVFLSLLAPENTRIAISRAPVDPLALRIHNAWRNFAHKFALPIEFDVTNRLSPVAGAPSGFESWIQHCSHITGTSVAEGFGLMFLEAAAWGKPFVGRNLAYLEHGLRKDRLYDRLLVPAAWIDGSILLDHLKTTMERNHRAWRRPLSQRHIHAAFESLAIDGWLDFGNLPEPLQQSIIERCSDPTQRQLPLVDCMGQRQSAVAWLARSLADRTPDQCIHVPASTYQKRLTGLYSSLARATAGMTGFVRPTDILTPHIQPETFHFLLSIPIRSARAMPGPTSSSITGAIC